MPTTTTRVSIPTGVYTAVTDGDFNVFIRPVTPVAMRLHIGQTAPASSTIDYMQLASSSVSFSDLEGVDKVFLMAEAEGAEVVVIAGG